MPALACVRLEAEGSGLGLAAFNLELGVALRLDAAEVLPGSAIVELKALKAFASSVKASGDAVVLATKGRALAISCGATSAQLPITPEEQWPKIPEASESTLQVGALELAAALKAVSYAASADETRYNLNGVHVGEGCVEATDGHRLAQHPLPEALKPLAGSILPLPLVAELERLKGGEVTVNYCPRTITATCGSVRVFGRLIEGDFPKTSQVIPKKSAFRLTTDRKGLISALKIVELCAPKRSHAVRLTINGALELFASDPDAEAEGGTSVEYSEREAVKGGGDAVVLDVNARYFLAALKALESVAVVLEGLDALSPITLKSGDGTGGAGLIMPLRI